MVLTLLVSYLDMIRHLEEQAEQREVSESEPVPFYLEATKEDRRQNWKTVCSFVSN